VAQYPNTSGGTFNSSSNTWSGVTIATKHSTPGYGYFGNNDSIYQDGVWIQTGNKEGFVVITQLGTGAEWYQSSSVYNYAGSTGFLVYSRAQLGSVASGASDDSIQPTYYPFQLPYLSYPLKVGSGYAYGANTYNASPTEYLVGGVAYDATNQNLYIYVIGGADNTNVGTGLIYVYHVNDPSPTQYQVTVNSGSSGTVMPSGSVQVNSGQSYLFYAIPNDPTATATISGCGGSIINNTYPNSASVAYQTGAITGPCTVTAFGGSVTNYTVSTSGSNVTFSPTSQSVASGASPSNFTISANSGYVLSGSPSDNCGSGGASCGSWTAGTGTYSMSACSIAGNCTVTASSIATYTITPSAGGGGTITPGTVQTVDSGGSQQFFITANSGFQIQAVYIDGTNIGSPSSYTFTNVTANHTISATFSQLAAVTKYRICGPFGNCVTIGSTTYP